MRADCAILGIDPSKLIPPEQQLDRAPDFELWPEHWLAWNVYLGCRTQWRRTAITGGLGPGRWVWEGLDYTGVEVLMRRYKVPEDKADEVFAQLQVLEVETVAIRNSRSP